MILENNIPLKPVGRRFASFRISLLINGYSSLSLCHYVGKTQGVTHVTPTAYLDYVSQEEWSSLYTKVKNLIDQHGINKAAELLHKNKFSQLILD